MLLPERLKLLLPMLIASCQPTYAQPGGGAGCLNVNDFSCFVNRYAAADPFANCDGSAAAPVLNANDFQCFLNAFAAGEARADCDGSCGFGGIQWTDLTLPAGALRFYIDPFTGDDGNPGTLLAPFRGLARGYSALRPGHPDQLLLRAGATFTEGLTISKASGSATTYMLIGAYGEGPRPRIRTPGQAFFMDQENLAGFAFVGLDIQALAPTSSCAGITAFDGWRHILVEDCFIAGFPVNLVFQEVGPGRLSDIRIRYSIIADSIETGSGHSQGIFMGSVDGWVIEGCVLDRNAYNKADMFCHNVYVHETCGPGVFRDNITARACSHGVQQRPGGVMENNLALGNAINLFMGETGPVRWNVALDSKDINAIDRRGIGYVIAGGGVCENNIAAHQVHGTDAIVAFEFDSYQGSMIRGNVVYDWTAPGGQCWPTCFQFDGGVGMLSVTGNKLWQTDGPGVLVALYGRSTDDTTAGGNSYFTQTPAGGCGGFDRFIPGNWRTLTGDGSSVVLSVPPVRDGSIAAYLASVGRTGDLPEFMAWARGFSRGNPHPTADEVNDWARVVFGVTPN